MADIYAPIRAGSDIAFLGGLINHVIHDQRWQTDPFFRTWLLHYTNATTIMAMPNSSTRGSVDLFSPVSQMETAYTMAAIGL